MTKGKLFLELYFLCERELRNKTNEVISQNRDIPVDDIKYVKTLYPKEVKIIKDFYGVEI